MNKDLCKCGKELTTPGVFLGQDEYLTPVVVFPCDCGNHTRRMINTMKPYTAKRCETFPPTRGDYQQREDGTMFCCPVCQALSPIAQPTHSIDGDGKVSPSVVCPNGCGFHSYVTLEGWDK